MDVAALNHPSTAVNVSETENVVIESHESVAAEGLDGGHQSAAVHWALPLDDLHPPADLRTSDHHHGSSILPVSSLLFQTHPQHSHHSTNASTTALPTTTTTTSSSPDPSLLASPLPVQADMWFVDASTDHIEIVIPSDTVILRGVGQDVEPTVLAGQVILRLPESTNIKDINLTFVGKLRTTQGDARSPAFRQTVQTNVFFSKDWSFLEETKSHKHTLKAGQHVFPFQLALDDTFPSSVQVAGASIVYKLRATVVRPSFSSNWVTQRSVNVIRGFSQEALEYNQTLEIENTWPGKIMYSVMIPHKAYAAGDEIPVSVKFTPLTKGVSVLAIDSVVKQYLSIRSGSSPLVQDGRTIVKSSHVLRDGEAMDVSLINRSPTTWDVNHLGGTQLAVTALATSAATATALVQSPGDETAACRSSPPQERDSDFQRGDNEIDTSLKLRLPVWVTPSNAADPITVQHKVKWSITLSNLDGHNSELRCALPIHILHPSLLDESRTASQQTRDILFGNAEATQTQILLPSYESHVQDRIANALDSVVPVGFAPNPLHNLDAATAAGPSNGRLGTGGSLASSADAINHPRSSAAGPSSGLGDATPPLGLVDTGLLMSLGDRPRLVAVGSGSNSNLRNDAPPELRRSNFRTSLVSSSRTSSRSSSPEPRELDLPATSSHSRSGMFGGFSLKPFIPFSKSNKQSQSQVQIQVQATSNPSSPQFGTRALGTRSRQSSIVGLRSEFLAGADLSSMQTLTELLSRVPNYERASQGFLGGGVPPLDASAGLPTYTEASRVRSEGSLLNLRGGLSAIAERSTSELPLRTSSGRRRNATFTLDP